MEFVNTEQAAYWAGRAKSWSAQEAVHDRVIGPAGRMAMERLDPRPGQVLVDLGCGTGQTTVELARRVGPGGQVVGVDIAAAMFERARQHLGDAGVGNVELVHADVQSTNLGQGRFDGAYSRFGVMFFSDPVAAFSNVHASLKSGAALSFACWQPLQANDWMSVPAQAAIAVLDVVPEMPAPDAPGPFALAEPEAMRRVLDAAGFCDIDIAFHDDFLMAPETGISEMADAALQVGAVQRMLENADPKTVELARQAIVDALESRLVNAEVALSRAFLLVRAVA
ncbi:MAG: class I SAM-dependent methyltransferase [Acidimicrobiales bacterium]|nr:class I SAM-dependent methyltransferase [Acidimicrobiales bacterium]